MHVANILCTYDDEWASFQPTLLYASKYGTMIYERRRPRRQLLEFY